MMRALEAMLLGQNPLIPEDADETGRDMIYVDDVIYANLLAADLPRGAGKVFNIGRGHAAHEAFTPHRFSEKAAAR